MSQYLTLSLRSAHDDAPTLMQHVNDKVDVNGRLLNIAWVVPPHESDGFVTAVILSGELSSPLTQDELNAFDGEWIDLNGIPFIIESVRVDD